MCVFDSQDTLINEYINKYRNALAHDRDMKYKFLERENFVLKVGFEPTSLGFRPSALTTVPPGHTGNEGKF